MAPASSVIKSNARASPILPLEIWIKLGIGPRRIEQRVHFNRCLGRTKIGPRKQRKTQIDCRAVERIYGVGKVETNVVLQIKFTRALDQDSCKIRPYTPITQFVCISQSRLGDRGTQPHTV